MVWINCTNTRYARRSYSLIGSTTAGQRNSGTHIITPGRPPAPEPHQAFMVDIRPPSAFHRLYDSGSAARPSPQATPHPHQASFTSGFILIRLHSPHTNTITIGLVLTPIPPPPHRPAVSALCERHVFSRTSCAPFLHGNGPVSRHVFSRASGTGT